MFDKRVWTTIFIWGFITIFLSNISDAPYYNDITWIGLITLLAGAVSTFAVWFFGSIDWTRLIEQRFINRPAQVEKHKHGMSNPAEARMQLLIQLMTEDERTRIKSRLMNEAWMESDDALFWQDAMAEQSDYRR